MTAPLKLAARGDKLSVLCVGAHSDDIEIGAGATLLQWKADGIRIDMLWCVLSAVGPREAEARSSAEDFLQGVERAHIETHHFRDGFFPAQSAEIKTWFEELKGRFQPDVILTHNGIDAHQDHRLTNDLKPRLVFSDIVMPGGISGLELARKVRRRFPEMPIVLTTGYSEHVGGTHGFDILQKPYELRSLAKALQVALKEAVEAELLAPPA